MIALLGNFPAKSIYTVLFLVSTIAAQQNIVLDVSGLQTLELVCTCNDFPIVVGLVVDNKFCGGYLTLDMPFILVIDTRRCHQMAVAVSPGQPVKW